ncbi:unnamed protein product [Calypogeia fissa]
MKVLSASSAHKNVLRDSTFFSNSFLLNPTRSSRRANPFDAEPKCLISSVWSFSSSPIYESHTVKCRNITKLLTQGGIRDLSSSRRAESLGFSSVLWCTPVVDRGFCSKSQSGYFASVKDDLGNRSTSCSSSLCDENLLDGDEQGQEEEDGVDLSEDADELKDGEMQSGEGEDDYRLWDVKPKTKEALESGLYLVGTPIGNLEDITLRALRILQSATCILAEDTRHSSKLLQHYGISTPTMSYHKFNENHRRRELIQRLQRGEVLALISDAGMPGISDPGSKLVKACVEENVKVFPIPGPSAALTALVASGLPTEEFSFVGFLPAQASARRKRLSAAAKESVTQIFYVPPHKLCRVLGDFISTFGASRRCAIAREMTKLHEEFWRSTLEEAKVEFEVRQPRGELTLIVEGFPEGAGTQQPTKEELMSRLEILMDAGKGPSEASKLVVEETSARRNVVYSLALEISKRSK